MCPICKNSNFEIVGFPRIGKKASKIIKKEYHVVKCSHCSLYYIYPEIEFSSEEWNYLYNEEYFPQMSRWYYKRREKDLKSRFDQIEKYHKSKVVTFLDVGCGEGYSLIESNKRGWKSYGIDITDNRTIEAKSSEITFYKVNLLDSDLPSDFFNAVYIDSVLEHIINPSEYLMELHRILKPGGILYIGVPNEDSLFNSVKNILNKFLDPKISSRLKPFVSPFHITGFNKCSLKSVLRNCDFKPKKFRNFACRMEFLKSKPLTKDYFNSMMLLPIYLAAVPLRKEVYLEAYVQKT